MSNDVSNTGCHVVYVVDDDKVVLQSTEALLAQSGYQTKCYSAAGDFLAEAPLHSCGCLVADVQMPEMNGMQLMQHLSSEGSTLAVIVISGVANVPTTVAVMQYGAATLLEKPYDAGDLLQAIDKALAQSRERWQRHNATRSLRDRLTALSAEERAVMKLMLRDEPNKAIASALGLSLRTVDRRRQAVLTKMQAESVLALATLLGTLLPTAFTLDTELS